MSSKLTRRLRNLAQLRKRSKVAVGQTPAVTVHSENKWRLLRYRRPRTEHALRRPILMVPSLINRYYVLDLAPGRSLVEYLLYRGHDVFMIDWGNPSDEDRFVTFDDVCDRYIGRAVRKAASLAETDDVHLLGYCLGGTLATIYTAARPDKVASLTALATPVSFEDDGLLTRWTQTPSFDVHALVGGLGTVPWQLLQASFSMMRPTLPLSKAVNVIDRAWDDEYLDGFFATERWGNDNIAFPGAAFERYITELYRENRLMKGTMTLSGRPVRLESITCPTLAITFEHDNIVTPESATPLVDRVGATDKQRIHLRGGHVGAVVSRKASESLWPQMSSFWAERDGASDRTPVKRALAGG